MFCSTDMFIAKFGIYMNEEFAIKHIGAPLFGASEIKKKMKDLSVLYSVGNAYKTQQGYRQKKNGYRRK